MLQATRSSQPTAAVETLALQHRSKNVRKDGLKVSNLAKKVKVALAIRTSSSFTREAFVNSRVS